MYFYQQRDQDFSLDTQPVSLRNHQILTALGHIVQDRFPEVSEPAKYMVSKTGDPAKIFKAAIGLY